MLNRIIRIADILQEIESFIESISFSEHNYVMALILMDYCNETVLKAVYHHLFAQEINKNDSMWKCWGDVNKELKSGNHDIELDALPLKTEILDTLHDKRNYVQHSGESPKYEDIIKYFANSKVFIQIVLKKVLGEDINSLSPVRYIKNRSYQHLLSKAIEFQESDTEIAGAFVGCAVSYANDLLLKGQQEVNKDIRDKIRNAFHEYCGGNSSGNIHEILNSFSDIGEQIHKNSKAIERIFQDGCNPPRNILYKLPAGHLMGSQSFCCVDHGQELTFEDIKAAINFAIKYIIRLEKLNMLNELNLDIDKGVTIEKLSFQG